MIRVFILKLFGNVAGLYLASSLFNGVNTGEPASLLIAAVVLTLLNMTVRPLIAFLSLPITLLSFGLFSLVINAIILSLTDLLVPSFSVVSFGYAILCSTVVTFISWIIYSLVDGD